jgi:hypothetical protein
VSGSVKVRALILTTVCALCTSLAVVACGGDKSASGPNPGASTARAEGTSGGVSPDEQKVIDAKCNFGDNVLEMFDASTNGTALPSTTIGTGCKDVRKFSVYSSLFK